MYVWNGEESHELDFISICALSIHEEFSGGLKEHLDSACPLVGPFVRHHRYFHHMNQRRRGRQWINFAWVTQHELPKAAKDEVKRPEGLPVRSRRVPRFLVFKYCLAGCWRRRWGQRARPYLSLTRRSRPSSETFFRSLTRGMNIYIYVSLWVGGVFWLPQILFDDDI